MIKEKVFSVSMYCYVLYVTRLVCNWCLYLVEKS
jgi:hypothetical protein